MDGIFIELDDRAVQATLKRLSEHAGRLAPVLGRIGEALAETTKQRFAQGRAPDGTPWAPNRPSTVVAFLDVFSGSRKKDGSLSKRGAARAASKRPLIGETRRLCILGSRPVGPRSGRGEAASAAADRGFESRPGLHTCITAVRR